ncbi:E3 ubiquitin-protein ligase LRSAM1 isoform X1 [Bombus vancouverensis nearcticus]|uniref:E3 ubiquitin-protein ligase LRSAM1-like isoform X1 n=1 Tax=Bombus bifarius TaxID=103933 RepID=A0A6P8MHS9_9HYME|nr:E3 ubiquitin-protein ligase LRSAM1-like isoform X1 [Bombus vancouverensis nearcticus]XP_033308964.1 E3 ubiquitin-protein ligase LRSAM1-like isoform X1 [Bombus bifarius]
MMSLPLGSKVNVDYKARLEHKLYLARENPEPIFDVSECALKHVPSGIYSLCRVFRKKVLWMYSNKLTSLSGGGALSDLSLLVVLDIRDNEFTHLPSDIMCLASLKELYLQDNNIRKLPNEIVHLSKLNILNVAKNKLKQLPEAMGNLKQLSMLDISHNKLHKLPKSLGYAQQLAELNIDGLNLLYPPQDILNGGTKVIIAFLANESGIKYSPEEPDFETDISRNISFEDMQGVYQNKNNDVQAALQKLEKMKEHRQNALLEVEKNIKQQQEYEMEMQTMLKKHRKKLLQDLALQQTQLQHELQKVQQERDSNRARLLSYIYNAEKEADNVIKEFLRNSEEERQTQAELLEKEKQEEMQLLSSCHTEQFMFRTKDTLLSMEKLLEEELHRTRKLEEHSKYRDCAAQSLLTLEVRNNDHLAQIMQDQAEKRQDLIDTLRQDEVLQKAAVAALLERSDARCWSIVQQVNLVQSQLAALTNIELERRKLEINQQLNEIAEKRVALSAILMNLLEQQKSRRDQLLETINSIEQQRCITNSRRQSQFWLMQYQSLMETRPQGLLEMLEPTLVRHVAIAGALHCLPFLASLPSLLPDLSDEQLKAIGIHCENDRTAIKLAVENYLAELKLNEFRTPIIPSAPSEEACTSSNYQEYNDTQSINTAECVICLDLQCEVIFLPCGHLCCCSGCANMISSNCPMCRSVIDHKIHIVKP